MEETANGKPRIIWHALRNNMVRRDKILAVKETIMKATGIVRRIDDLGRVVIPKEIRRTMRIREGDPTQMTLVNWLNCCILLLKVAKRLWIE